MSTQSIDLARCPFCNATSTRDRAGFDVTTCDQCGSQWRVPRPDRVAELRRQMAEKFPEAAGSLSVSPVRQPSAPSASNTPLKDPEG